MTAYAGEYEQSPADTPEEQIVNRQRAVERAITAELAALDTPSSRPGGPLATI